MVICHLQEPRSSLGGILSVSPPPDAPFLAKMSKASQQPLHRMRCKGTNFGCPPGSILQGGTRKGAQKKIQAHLRREQRAAGSPSPSAFSSSFSWRGRRERRRQCDASGSLYAAAKWGGGCASVPGWLLYWTPQQTNKGLDLLCPALSGADPTFATFAQLTGGC